jgi:hypothetical protein
MATDDLPAAGSAGLDQGTGERPAHRDLGAGHDGDQLVKHGAHQYDLGRPSTEVEMKFRTISWEIGASLSSRTSRHSRSMWYSFA